MFIRILSFMVMISAALYSEEVKVDLSQDTFINKGRPEKTHADAKFGGVREWYGYYLIKFKIDDIKKIEIGKVKEAYFDFYISWTEIMPRGFAPEETITQIVFYRMLVPWKESATWLYPDSENKENKWNGLERGKHISKEPVVTYRIERPEQDIRGKMSIPGFSGIAKKWLTGEWENYGIVMMVRQGEMKAARYIQINVDTSKAEALDRRPCLRIVLSE